MCNGGFSRGVVSYGDKCGDLWGLWECFCVEIFGRDGVG